MFNEKSFYALKLILIYALKPYRPKKNFFNGKSSHASQLIICVEDLSKFEKS